MAYSLTQFQNSAGPDQLSALDNNFVTIGAQAPIPCGVAGTNTLTLTQNATGVVPTTTITAYTSNMAFSGVASATNTGAVTATVGTVGALNVYKDTVSGPAALSGGEIVAGNAFTLLYDATLNTGAGGFHLITSTSNVKAAIQPSSVQINSGATLTNVLSGAVTLTFTATPGWTSQDQTFTLSGLPPAIPLVGDFVQIVPPGVPTVNASYQGYVNTVGSLSSVASVATLNVRLVNSGSLSIGSVSGSYRYLATRSVP